MMRVLHVVASDRVRGAESFAADLVRTLGERDLRQRVAVIRGGARDAVAFAAPVRALTTRPALRGPAFDVVAAGRLHAELRRSRPTIVQLHGGEALKIALASGIAAPMVYRRIGAAPARLRRRTGRALYAAALRRPRRIVAVADAVRAETIDLFGLPPSRVVTIPNAVDTARFERSIEPSVARRALGLRPDRRVVLCLGSLSWEKDPLAAVAAAAPILRARSDVELVFAGDGVLRAAAADAARRAGIGDRVRFLGVVRDVPGALAAADVVLLASRQDGMEGMPAAVIEAGLARRPVVAYDVAGVREVVTDGATGILVPPGRVADLRAALERVLADPVRAASMGAAARRRCGAFDIGRVAPRYLEVYEEVAGG